MQIIRNLLCTGTSIPLLRSTPDSTGAQRLEDDNATVIDRFGHGTQVAGEQVADGNEAQTSPLWKVAAYGAGICA